MKIILGSQSKSRKEMLEEMGFEFEVMPADIDEKAIRLEDPEQLTLTIARAKADALISRISEPALLITSDQVVLCNGEILEKPENADEARKFLRNYAKYPAEVINGLVVTNIATKKQVEGVSRAKVIFQTIPEDVIDKLIEQGDIFTQAGGFSVRNLYLKPFVKEIDGTIDSVEGLSKELVSRLLKEVQE